MENFYQWQKLVVLIFQQKGLETWTFRQNFKSQHLSLNQKKSSKMSLQISSLHKLCSSWSWRLDNEFINRTKCSLSGNPKSGSRYKKRLSTHESTLFAEQTMRQIEILMLVGKAFVRRSMRNCRNFLFPSAWIFISHFLQEKNSSAVCC